MSRLFVSGGQSIGASASASAGASASASALQRKGQIVFRASLQEKEETSQTLPPWDKQGPGGAEKPSTRQVFRVLDLPFK